jgi:hypothetical protein
MNNIFVMRGTTQTGPFPESEVRAQLASGALARETLVWWEGQPEWLPIARTPLAAPPAQPGVPLEPRTSTLAIVSLIAGLLGCPTMICYGLGIAFGIVAVVTGHLARAEIKREPWLQGKGMALAGLILGYIWSSCIILAFISVVAISVLIALGNQVKGVYSTINSQLAAPASNNP